jgi:uncharacterized membrane protein
MTVASAQPPNPVAFRLAALLAYPALIIVALWLQEPGLRALGLPLLAVALVGLWPEHTPGRVILIASLVLAGLVVGVPSLALWPPGLACLGVAIWFASTLKPGSNPAIKRFAIAVHEIRGQTLPLETDAWTRTWTAIWTVLLVMIGTVAIGLAVADLTGWWLAWIMGISPLMAITTLIVEHCLRVRRFPDHEPLSLKQFLLLLSHIRPEHLAR